MANSTFLAQGRESLVFARHHFTTRGAKRLSERTIDSSPTGCSDGVKLRDVRYQATRPVCVSASVESASTSDQDKVDENAFVEIGIIGPPHGVRGEVKVQSTTDFPEQRFGVPGVRWLQAPRGKLLNRRKVPPRQVTLKTGREGTYKGHTLWILALDGVETRDEAAALRGCRLMIRSEDRDDLDNEDEFYIQDLIGLDVYNQADEQHVGVVASLLDGTGTYDLLRVGVKNGEPNSYVLVPFVDDFVPVIDLKQNRIEITPPEGLLDLVITEKKKKKKEKARRKKPGTKHSSSTDESD